LISLHYPVLTGYLGDSPAEMVAATSSRAMRKRLYALLDAVRVPDGPAFVVLNDDMPDRASVKEANTMNRLMLQWMEQLWPHKVCISSAWLSSS
jgi:hypothetical protein